MSLGNGKTGDREMMDDKEYRLEVLKLVRLCSNAENGWTPNDFVTVAKEWSDFVLGTGETESRDKGQGELCCICHQHGSPGRSLVRDTDTGAMHHADCYPPLLRDRRGTVQGSAPHEIQDIAQPGVIAKNPPPPECSNCGSTRPVMAYDEASDRHYCPGCRA